jgi:hypothetical protein
MLLLQWASSAISQTDDGNVGDFDASTRNVGRSPPGLTRGPSARASLYDCERSSDKMKPAMEQLGFLSTRTV